MSRANEGFVKKLAAIFLLLCASTLCVLSIFYVNQSWLNLAKYAAGTEFLPFQRRLLMIPVVRWASASHLMQHGAARFSLNLTQNEPLTAAKFACMMLSVLLVNALGLWTVRSAKKLGVHHFWLIWAFIVVILLASYAARFEQALWYPYDLPHMVVFGFGIIALFTDDPWVFLAVCSIDVFVRETSVFLIGLAGLLQFRSRTWRAVVAATALLWVFSRGLAQHLYPNNIFQYNHVPWYKMIAPWHWPQLFSIVGFLWIPVWLGLRYLPDRHRLSLYAASFCMLFTFFFATWNETRVWVEWTVFFAILASLEVEAAFASGTQHVTLDVSEEERLAA